MYNGYYQLNRRQMFSFISEVVFFLSLIIFLLLYRNFWFNGIPLIIVFLIEFYQTNVPLLLEPLCFTFELSLYFKLNYPNTIFLLIVWDFHTVHPDGTHFLVLLGPTSHPCDFLLKQINKQANKNSKSNLCCPYTLWSMVKPRLTEYFKTKECSPTTFQKS